MGNATPYVGGRKTLMIIAVLLTTVTCTASSYANNVCLPYLLKEMNAMDYYAFYAAMSSVGMMAALPMTGSLSSKFGARNVILFGMAAQFISRIALMYCGQPVLFGVLYCLMGFFSGMYMAAPYSVMAEIVAPEERAKYFGFIAAFSALGALAGPYLTGLVVENISAGAGLLVYVVFAIFPVVVFLAMYPNSKRPSSSFDLPGMMVFVVFVLCLVLWLSLGGKMFSFASPIGIAMPVVAVIALALLVRREKKVDFPAVPIAVFRKKRFRFAFIVQALAVAYSTCAAAYGIRYAQEVMQESATVSSTVTMPQTVVQFILGLFIGGMIGKSFKKRFRPFALLALVCYAAGLFIFYLLNPTTPIFVIYLATGIGGIGQAIVQSTYIAFYQTELEPEEIRPAQGMYQFAQTGGSSVFVAIVGACMNIGMGLQQVFLVGTGFMLAALVIAIFTFRFTKEEIAAETLAAK